MNRKIFVTGDISTRDKLKLTGFIDGFSKISETTYLQPRLKDQIKINDYYDVIFGESGDWTDIEYTNIGNAFNFGTQDFTIISKEYPQQWEIGRERYYPINDEANNLKYKKYKDLMDKDPKYILGGRLAEYKYYDMHQVIGSALSKFKKNVIK